MWACSARPGGRTRRTSETTGNGSSSPTSGRKTPHHLKTRRAPLAGSVGSGEWRMVWCTIQQRCNIPWVRILLEKDVNFCPRLRGNRWSRKGQIVRAARLHRDFARVLRGNIVMWSCRSNVTLFRVVSNIMVLSCSRRFGKGIIYLLIWLVKTELQVVLWVKMSETSCNSAQSKPLISWPRPSVLKFARL